MSAFEVLRTVSDKSQMLLTADGEKPLVGRVCVQPDPAKVVVFVGTFEWFEFTAQSDIEFYCSTPGSLHLHVHG